MSDTAALTVTKMIDSVQENTLLMVLCLMSAMEMFAAVALCDKLSYCGNYYAWAVASGAVSLSVAIFKIILHHKCQELYNKVAPFTSLFLFLWWIPGAGVTTFKGPFYQVGNGYFGAWGSFFCSFMLIRANWEELSNIVQKLTDKDTVTTQTVTTQTVEP
ncbi:hypothetical protein TetV_332 [Tetraselmis virus 1]|uniref:Transmembrane protein n=1 Tax=Tetraselmis virus 1 TaxID=2060617 RepID=A0A2P0VNE3_9VIRU|nr:hypothetical protein QJ968_gp332 [Tetraselmis virus 1]AUF82424.1 hypothetical protein TetV_332 [Tetraselmis virus 1]